MRGIFSKFRTTLAIGFLWSGIAAQTYSVGDVVSDFSMPICANGTGDWTLYDYFGDQNGGNYNVIWINVFTSW